MGRMRPEEDIALSTLLALLRIYRDSAEGYATAARDLPDLEVRRELEPYRKELLRLVKECAKRIRVLRGDPDDAPATAAGGVHRTWMDLRSATAANPTAALLTEMERGEDIAVDAIKAALRTDGIDPATHALLQTHYEKIQAAHDRVKQLRDRATLART